MLMQELGIIKLKVNKLNSDELTELRTKGFNRLFDMMFEDELREISESYSESQSYLGSYLNNPEHFPELDNYEKLVGYNKMSDEFFSEAKERRDELDKF